MAGFGALWNLLQSKAEGFRDFREILGLKIERDFYFTSCQDTLHEWVLGQGKQEFWRISFQISRICVSWKSWILFLEAFFFEIRKVLEIQKNTPFVPVWCNVHRSLSQNLGDRIKQKFLLISSVWFLKKRKTTPLGQNYNIINIIPWYCCS